MSSERASSRRALTFGAACRFTKKRAFERARAGIGYVPQGRHIFPHLTVAENLAMGAYIRDDKAQIAADCEHAYATFPRLAERRAQLAGTLSGGEQQMLAIGRALMGNPKFLMLDEPAAGLSAEEIRTVVLESAHILPKKHASILRNLFDVGEVTVEDVMVPRAKIEALRLEERLQLREIGAVRADRVRRRVALELQRREEIRDARVLHNGEVPSPARRSCPRSRSRSPRRCR